MPPKLYLYGAGIVLCAAIALISAGASARNSSRCLTFQGYDSEAGTVAIGNSCSQCRMATIRWCDGSRLSLQVPGSSSYRVPGFIGCTMRKTADTPCEQPPRSSSRQSPKRGRAAKKEKKATAVSSTQKRLPIEPYDNHRAGKGSVPGDQAASPAQGKGVPSAANSMEAITEPSGNGVAAIPSQKVNPATRPEIGKRTPRQMALFPSASEHDWNTLLCTESGQSLIRQSEALLNRQEVLLEMIVRISFDPHALEKANELDAASKELQAIDRELRKFPERAKKIVQNHILN